MKLRPPTLKRYHPLQVRYACGHTCQEDRGAMSTALRAAVLAECVGKPCPACKMEQDRAARETGETAANPKADRCLWD